MTWLAQATIPLKELGRVRLPSYRIRFKDGFVRLGYNQAKTAIVATLEDREGHLVSSPTQADALARASLMGHAIVYHLMQFNKFQPGEAVGNREQVLVAV